LDDWAIAAAAELAKVRKPRLGTQRAGVVRVACRRPADRDAAPVGCDRPAPGDLARSTWLSWPCLRHKWALEEGATQASGRSSQMILSNPQRWPLGEGAEDPAADTFLVSPRPPGRRAAVQPDLHAPQTSRDQAEQAGPAGPLVRDAAPLTSEGCRLAEEAGDWARRLPTIPRRRADRAPNMVLTTSTWSLFCAPPEPKPGQINSRWMVI
jgi:hypothetical protein